MLRCRGEANVTEYVVSTTIRYTHFHWLFYKLKRSRQEVTRTCLKRGCIRSFHERQKQTESINCHVVQVDDDDDDDEDDDDDNDDDGGDGGDSGGERRRYFEYP